MTLTVKAVREALGHRVDQVSKDKSGGIIVRRTFFYRHGGSSEVFADTVERALRAAGLPAAVMEAGEHNAAFRGGASVSKSTHWWARVAERA